MIYHRILLEHGVAEIQAGPTGGSSMWLPVKPGGSASWQTPRERGEAKRHAFTLLVGKESAYGVPATEMVPFLHSDTSIRWSATLEPFESELPIGCDWVEWVSTRDPSGEAARICADWIRRDGDNPALVGAIPEQFVRSRVIGSANRDLILAAGSGYSVSQDPIHVRVVANRLNDDDGDWRLQGYVLPILIPSVGQLPWEGIAAIRKEKGVQHFRGILEEIEYETMDVAISGGDLERAVHHAAEERLAGLAARVDTLASTSKRTVVGLLIGVSSGIATVGVTGPLGILASSALGTAAGAVLDGRAVVRNRRVRQWIGVLNQIKGAAGPGPRSPGVK